MSRALLISLLCFTLALMGVTGVHAHVPASPGLSGGSDAHAHHHGAYVISVVDTDHDSDHDEDGDIDIEPLIKAFGKSTLAAVIAIVATLIGIVVALGRLAELCVPVTPPLRPPKPRLRFFLLPPSHAPPASLH
jgi:hypothetical protein